MKKKLEIDIYSDVDYEGYLHANQMIFNTLNDDKDIKVVFYHRFLMNGLKMKYILNIYKKLFSRISIDKLPRDKSSNIVKVFNLPSSNFIFDFFNEYFLYRKIKKNVSNDICITFLPSLSLKEVFNKYDTIIYYCVHDSDNQSYALRNKEYEKKLIEKSKIILCDNLDVLKRISNDSIVCDIFSENKSKYIYIPPPVPSAFFEYKIIEDNRKKYDFVYFGSIHENIDVTLIKNLAHKYKIILISYEKLNIVHDNIIEIDGTNDMVSLVKNIHKAKGILFPYSNSKFMDTISPAKLNQSLATGLPIYCSNKKITKQYELNYIDSDFSENIKPCSNSDSMRIYSEKNIYEKVKNLMLECL
ncbi:hypothetical protein [Photobacterium leiognathi]|uniref:hypothetical protein n=1 Tax=Photobacterium leiognathi TaxID=553611 RepID=UPI002981396F|nr:hypothetical protein [Photobacterium leiognathi]